jgi:hypothetical protein
VRVAVGVDVRVTVRAAVRVIQACRTRLDLVSASNVYLCEYLYII